MLEDERRLLSGRTVTTAMGLTGRGQGMARFLESKALKPFVSNELAVAIRNPIVFLSPRGGPNIHGYEATVLPELCSTVIDAHVAGKISKNQEGMVEPARVLFRAFGKVGIIALVDEATGFQYERQRTDLQDFLAQFLSEELRRWVRTFPKEYFTQLCRLKNVTYRPDMRMPQYFGHLTRDIVYKRLEPFVLAELEDRTEKDGAGRKRQNYFNGSTRTWANTD